MESILRLNKASCRNCHKCIRYCPVKAIRFSAGQAHIVENECILCGRCFSVCPQNAKQISSDLEKVHVMVMNGPVYASIAPTFAAAFPGIGIDALEDALKQLGFAGVEETAVGATIVKREYERILREETPNVMISSCCSSVNLLVRKYYPDVLFALAPVMSPLQAHCAEIKRRHPDAQTVFIGPCISKKHEAAEGDLIDAVLSFEELRAWLKEKNIALVPREDQRPGGKTRMFPTTGGVLATMEKIPGYTYLAVDDTPNCMAVLEEVRRGQLHHCFIELSVCQGSCSNGPLMHPPATPAANTLEVLRYTCEGDFPVEQPIPKASKMTFTPIEQTAVQPEEWEIDELLVKMHKSKASSQLNCGACGYNSCRDRAAAVIQGKAEMSMCLPYMMKKAEGFSNTVLMTSPDGILVLNDALEVQKINPEARRLLQVPHEMDVLGDHVSRLMDPEIFDDARRAGKPIHTSRLPMVDYSCYVDRTVLYNADYHLFICTMRDITKEVRRQSKKMETRMQAVNIADDVAKKQLKIVQEIASLLGETAADTLIAVEHLKETISDD